MKIKQLLTKTLLVAVGLLAGQSVWADPIETVGTLSSGWWEDFSNTYTLEGYGKYHFQFTTTNANEGTIHKTWLLVATDGNDSHGGGGTEYFVWRGEGYAWAKSTNSNDTPAKLVCSNTYATANPTGAGIQAAMNGAAVEMVITRESNNIYATATVTPTNGENEFTMSFSYLYGDATSANVGLFFTVQNAQVVLNTAEQTSKWTTVWNADFSSAPSGMAYSISAGSCNITNGYLWFKNDAGSGTRTQTASFTDAKFNVDTNWIMEFDWNCGQSNNESSNVSFATNNGNAFTLSWKNNGNGQVTVTDASSKELSTTLPVAGYNIGSISTWSHIVITGDTDNGIYLTITNGGTTYVNNVRVTSTYGYPVSFNGTLGKSVAAMGMDNISFKTPAVAGFVATPTSEITGAAGTSRKFTLSCLTDGATIFYATSDLEKGAAGWNTYSGEVTTDAATIYAYAKNGDDTSDKMNFATGAGTTIDLLPATVTHSNNGVYTIASNQSAILGAPTATIHYQIDGGSEQTSTNASVNVNIATDGTLTYWLTADGYGATDPADETVYAAVGYAITKTIDFKTSNDNSWSSHGDEVTVTGDGTHTYYKYKDQGGNILGDGLLATTFRNSTMDNSWRIQRYYGGTSPYNNTEYIALKNLAAGQIVQFACTSAPSIVANLTAVPASTYTGTYTYSATAAGDVIVSLAKGVVIKTIKLCATSVNKTISDAGWATYCSPYALDLSNATGLTGAYIVTGGENGVLTKTPVMNGTVPANTGLLLKGNGECAIPVVASGDASNVTGNKLVGVTAETTIDANTGYVLLKENEVLGFYKNTNDFTLGANTAYLPVSFDQTVAARASYLLFDDMTGISQVAGSKVKTNGVIYNLNGQRVSNPTKGIYIIDGVKVAIE